MRTPIVSAFLAALFGLGAIPARAATCESLTSATLPDTTITLAQSVAAGVFAPPYGAPLDKMPAFCRIAGVTKPTSDSYIRFEVWLPASDWNGKFLGVGNGGFAGSIGFTSMGGNLRRGYATAGTDTGHEGEAEDASWAYRHPEKIADFGYRGLHLTVANAKRLIEAFYARPAQRSYFDSCSDGGREALMEAQRFPEDFDGILAGAPANYWTHMLSAGVEGVKSLYGDPTRFIQPFKIPVIAAAVLAACDAADGVKDGIVSDPTKCHFDPSTLLCKAEETRDCLTAPQVAGLKRIYSGATDAHGRQFFPGYLPGAEEGRGGWSPWIVGNAPGAGSGTAYMENYFRYMVFSDPTWNPLTANLQTAVRAADEKTAQALNSNDPDLSRFQAHGGKLIVYHGWNDPAIPAPNSINYYNAVIGKMSAQNADSVMRLYMVPGMQHCIGGPGPNWFGQLGTTTAQGPQHGIYDALEQWVEKGTVPGPVIATKYTDDNPGKPPKMTRPLCPYPQAAKYKGAGETNDYTNFECQLP